MNRHITLYAKLARQVKDKLLNFLDDPTSCTHQDVERFPKEIFANLAVNIYRLVILPAYLIFLKLFKFIIYYLNIKFRLKNFYILYV